MTKNVINEKELCRKYRTNVNRLIRAWKKGVNDLEITRATGINPATLQQIREDIALAHRRFRLLQKREAPVKTDPDLFSEN